MDRNRIVQLALEELERQRIAVDAEIMAIRGEMREEKVPISENVKLAVAVAGDRRRRTPGERSAQSLRMTKYWAAKRAKTAKAKKPMAPKPQFKKAAVSKAISNAMRIYWAKKKAKAAGKETKAKPKIVPKKPSK
jgi:hypothetical protein